MNAQPNEMMLASYSLQGHLKTHSVPIFLTFYFEIRKRVNSSRKLFYELESGQNLVENFFETSFIYRSGNFNNASVLINHDASWKIDHPNTRTLFYRISVCFQFFGFCLFTVAKFNNIVIPNFIVLQFKIPVFLYDGIISGIIILVKTAFGQKSSATICKNLDLSISSFPNIITSWISIQRSFFYKKEKPREIANAILSGRVVFNSTSILYDLSHNLKNKESDCVYNDHLHNRLRLTIRKVSPPSSCFFKRRAAGEVAYTSTFNLTYGISQPKELLLGRLILHPSGFLLLHKLPPLFENPGHKFGCQFPLGDFVGVDFGVTGRPGPVIFRTVGQLDLAKSVRGLPLACE